jgi:hypothetical protein
VALAPKDANGNTLTGMLTLSVQLDNANRDDADGAWCQVG